ncbi:MAG: hypothetical protein M0Z75_03345 [Nitrospiraceae bacterium]|nr:hypothetical protein [Nitrospiraceae bacterium]
METENLKALALKVLQGNTQGNFSETGGFQGRKLEGVKSAEVSTIGNCGNGVETAPRMAVKIHSRILDAYLWVVQNEADRKALQGVSEPVYAADEIHKLHAQKPSPEALRRVHEVKQAFPGAIVREVKPGGPETRKPRVEKGPDARKSQAAQEAHAKGLFA